MAEPATGTSRPGVSVGPTSEFSLFFRVKPGHGDALREALRALQTHRATGPGSTTWRSRRSTRPGSCCSTTTRGLLFATSFDGPWDAYMEDFFTSGPTLQLFDVIFRHVEGYDGLPDLAAVKAFVLGAQVTAAAYARNYGGTVKEIRKAQRVNKAFQQVLDDPEAAEALQHPALKPLLDEAADSRRREPTSRSDGGAAVSDHISGPRALADPIADITDVYAFPSPERPGQLVLVMNTLPFAPPSARFSDGLVYRFRLRPLTAARQRRPAPFAVGAEEFVVRLRLLRRRCTATAPRADQDGTCTTPAGETVAFSVDDEQGGSAHGVRVFAGPRWDPFIMDAPAALKTIATGQARVHRSGRDLPGRQERPQPRRRGRLRQLLGGAELVGVVAETLTRGKLNVRIERVGRPEVKNMMLAPKQFDQVNRDLEIRDLYNMEDAFQLARRPTRAPIARG